MRKVAEALIPVVIAAAGLLTMALGAAGQTQEYTVCNSDWTLVDRGQTLRHTNIELTLPPGSFRTIMSTDGRTILICHPETDSRVEISVETGAEEGRFANDAAANALMDQIVAAVRIVTQGQISTPVPAPTIPPPDVTPTGPCPFTPGNLARGGDTVGTPRREIEVTLPSPGTYRHSFLVSEPGGLLLTVCHLETNARVFISATTGRETSRQATTPEGNAVLDQILSTIRHILPTPSLECDSRYTQAAGGETLRTQGGLQVTLPAPGDYLWLVNTSGIALIICHVQTQSSISLLTRTGGEARRVVGDPAGAAVLDQILASVRLAPQSVVRPPDTGDAGLR